MLSKKNDIVPLSYLFSICLLYQPCSSIITLYNIPNKVMNSRLGGSMFTLLVIQDQEEQSTKVPFLCYFLKSSKEVDNFGMRIPPLFIVWGRVF